MTYQIRVTAKGHQVYQTANGITTLDVGPAWPMPREAIRYSDTLETLPAATPPRQSATPPAGASPDAASRTPVASGAPRPALTVEDRHPQPSVAVSAASSPDGQTQLGLL